MQSTFKNLLSLNFAVLVIATAAPIGGFVSTKPEISIWTRCVCACLAIAMYMMVRKISFRFEYRKDLSSFIVCALLQGIHWVTYFYALHLAGAGLGLIALFTFPIFTTLLEPIILKTTFNPKHLLVALLVVIGLTILTPAFTTGNNTSLGILFGIISAIFFATRNILMKINVSKYNPSMLMFYQNGLIALFLIPAFILVPINYTTYQNELPFLVLLGVLTTAFGHTLFVNSFKNFSATTASLLSCIQPIYGFLLAYFFLNEIPTLKTLIGGSIIMSAVVIESLLIRKKN